MMNTKAMNANAAAEYVGCSKALLQLMRRQGRGPAHYKVGKLVRYRLDDLDAYIEENKKRGDKE